MSILEKTKKYAKRVQHFGLTATVTWLQLIVLLGIIGMLGGLKTIFHGEEDAVKEHVVNYIEKKFGDDDPEIVIVTVDEEGNEMERNTLQRVVE